MTPAARFVVLTTYDGDEDIYRALQAGAKAYLLKGMTNRRVDRNDSHRPQWKGAHSGSHR